MSYEEQMRELTLERDKKEFMGVLTARFGIVPKDIQRKIEEISDLDVLDRLFLVAVNAAEWDVFVSELLEGKDSFKIVGEAFNPYAKGIR